MLLLFDHIKLFYLKALFICPILFFAVSPNCFAAIIGSGNPVISFNISGALLSSEYKVMHSKFEGLEGASTDGLGGLLFVSNESNYANLKNTSNGNYSVSFGLGTFIPDDFGVGTNIFVGLEFMHVKAKSVSDTSGTYEYFMNNDKVFTAFDQSGLGVFFNASYLDQQSTISPLMSIGLGIFELKSKCKFLSNEANIKAKPGFTSPVEVTNSDVKYDNRDMLVLFKFSTGLNLSMNNAISFNCAYSFVSALYPLSSAYSYGDKIDLTPEHSMSVRVKNKSNSEYQAVKGPIKFDGTFGAERVFGFHGILFGAIIKI